MYEAVDARTDDDGLEEMMNFFFGLLKPLKLLLVTRFPKKYARERMKCQR
jgi:hypothetical protein